MSDDPNGPRVPDPFPLTSDPATYFPRVAFESALAEVIEALAETPPCAALIGEPGLGKTLLLHVLEERLEGAYECVYLPYPRLEGEELWAFVAAALGLRPSEDARAAVLRRARRHAETGKALALLVDDAAALLAEPRIELIHSCRSPGVALVMAFTSDDRKAIETLPAHVRRIDLGPPMTLAETRAYVRARLRRVDPGGGIAARLDPVRMAELHEASEGVPARLHALLDAWLRNAPGERREVAPPAPPPRATVEARPIAAPLPASVASPSPDPVEHPGRFARRKRSRTPLALTVLLVLLAVAAGFWLATQGRAPEVVLQAEPPPEPEPAPLAATVPTPTPEPLAATAPTTTPEPPTATAPPPTPEPPAVAPIPEPPVGAAPAPPPEEPVAAPAPVERPTPVAPPAPATVEHKATSLPTPVLMPPPPGPRLSVNAQPWADIELDGRPVGQTPLGELPISPGSHQVKAKLPDGRVLERRIDAGAGDLYLAFP